MNKDNKKEKFRQERKQSEYEQKIIDIRRVARVVAGGRRFNFRVTVVCGNRRGEVGVGIGKAENTSSAIEKAFRNAKKNLIKIPLTANSSIPHETEAKFAASHIFIKPAKSGKGLVAGGSVRTVLSLAGITDAAAKILSPTKNKITNARAAIEALRLLKFKNQNAKIKITT
jgi:small subunit ribosomal protein S5